ncbi:uncharacterized protein EKO05_0007462 [Ascochyta rabiei]|uniref:Uncharacterized protein n=1 Tax=Didymella rabiei TaxID=5454 RepID=A0A163EBL4_DIDRA|nr:uncharacterized protein EKO05_0007462 [Ascochyta rabiei]KZM23617.1 hypothetical protein ST47_g5216 [Ascochyta rabiei]UPX17086.1 hypothetical protein EKO05_0007462 [Ascochyta rabiei]
MLFTTILLAGLASAAPALSSREATTGLDPWEITSVFAGRPSGRPGSGTNSSLRINIKQPNTINVRQAPTGQAVLPPFEASCTWSWVAAGKNFPVGVETLCIPGSYGNFTMTLSGTNQADFTVAIKETREVNVLQQRFVRIFDGDQAFKVGDGLWRQNCGGSGVCSWQVAAGSLPIEVHQELTESIGSCEDTGSC